ncbi:MAG: FtsX-like permease family protein, partial [Anaerolineae bacterium]
MTLKDVAGRRDWLAGILRENMRFPLQSIYMQSESPTYELRAIPGDTSFRYDREDVDSLRVAVVQDIASHIRIIQGAEYDESAAPGDFTPIWIERAYAAELGVQVGDRYTMGSPGARPESRISVVIAGIWEPISRNDPFWYKDPIFDFYKSSLTTPANFEAHISAREPARTSFNFWYFVFDESRLNLDRGEYYINAINFIGREAQRQLPGGKMDVSPLAALNAGQARKQSMQLVLSGFAAPLLAMLVYFIASVSSMAAREQRREIALFSSRGVTQGQVMAIIFLETALLLAVAVPLGLLIGVGLASLMSWSVSFMQFEARRVLPVFIDSVDWRIVGAGLALCVLARLVPTWRNSRVSIITYERESARIQETPIFVRLFFLAILMAVTYYAYRQITLRGTLAMVSWSLTDASNDPVLLAAPSLFLFTMPLLAVELFSVLMRPFTWLGRQLPSVTAYLGFIGLGRESSLFRAPTYLLVLCLTLGAFFASLARSADTWLIDRRRYEVGADFTFKQGILDITTQAGGGGSFSGGALGGPIFSAQASAMLPIEEYYKIPGVAEATWVSEFDAIPQVRGGRKLRLLSVDRIALPKVIYFRRDFSSEPLGGLMNQLASQADAIILPRSVLTATGLQIGDPFPVDMMLTQDMAAAGLKPFRLDFKITGVFDYFPTVYHDKPGALVNADYLDAMTGAAFPNGMWMRLTPDADTAQILEALNNLRVQPNRVKDLAAIIYEDQQRLEYVGIFGLLSICFLAAAALAAIGILVYSLSSITTRSQRFAALRALGLTQGQVMRMILIEYAFTLAYGILAGTALGVVASMLYVPLFPLSDEKALPVPPFRPIIDWEGAAWLAGLMALALALILAGVLLKVWRERISEVLRMGAWE